MLKQLIINTGTGISRLRGLERQLSILIFHRVHARPDLMFPSDPDAAQFEWMVRLIRSNFNLLPLDEAITRYRDHELPPHAACITFDDGYADNHQVAMPILRKYQASATFFVATGFLNGGCMWNDVIIEQIRGLQADSIDLEEYGLGSMDISSMPLRRRAAQQLVLKMKYFPIQERLQKVQEFARRIGGAIPGDIMMTDAQLREMDQAGMVIGGHTVNHPILATIPDAEARQEIETGKQTLESILDKPVQVFAFPNGKRDADYTASHVEMVREAGFIGSVSTHQGASSQGGDAYQLCRFTPWDRKPTRFAARLAVNLMTSEGCA